MECRLAPPPLHAVQQKCTRGLQAAATSRRLCAVLVLVTGAARCAWKCSGAPAAGWSAPYLRTRSPKPASCAHPRLSGGRRSPSVWPRRLQTAQMPYHGFWIRRIPCTCSLVLVAPLCIYHRCQCHQCAPSPRTPCTRYCRRAPQSARHRLPGAMGGGCAPVSSVRSSFP